MLYETIKLSSKEDDLWYNKAKNILRNDLSLSKLRNIASDIPELTHKSFIPKMKEIELISEYRNGSIHFSEKSFSPDENDARIVFTATINTLKKYFKHRSAQLPTTAVLRQAG